MPTFKAVRRVQRLAGKQSSLSSLMSSLGTVEAPGDFDFRLRARLAAERQTVGQVAAGSFSFGFRFAAVAVALVAAAAFMFVSYRNNQISEPTVALNPGNPDKAAANPASGTVEKGSPAAVAIDVNPNQGKC